MGLVFIVDDSATTRASVDFTLKENGLEVVQAEDGPKCLAAIPGLPKDPDLFILDVNMPGMDGIALIGEIRKVARTKFTPILMLTTESQDTKKAEGKAAGASGWLVKPFDPPQLVEVVRRFVK
ncbi:MAG: response regulator [Spirochaetes bacterium]|nr:response regulator [Spirochaetota bacterium]